MVNNKKCSVKFQVNQEQTLDTFESLLRDNGYLVLTEYQSWQPPKVHTFFSAGNPSEFSYHQTQLMWIAELVKNAYTY